MKHLKALQLLLLFLATSFISLHAGESKWDDGITDYSIKIEVDGISNDKAILAYYYMDKKYIKDTIPFDENGVALIQGDYDFATGVYLLAFPSRNLSYFELLIGQEPSFSMKTDTSDFIDNMTIKGSLENELFYDNMRFLIAQGQISNNLKQQAVDLDQESDEYKAILGKLTEMDIAVKAKRNKMILEHPDAFYTKIIMAMSDIDLPENPDPRDSSYAYRYYQQHYFDNIDFNDIRLTRTPFLLKKITSFLDNYTIPLPDSINVAAERIIDASMVNYEMFQFCLVGIFNKYAKSKIMSHELVYVNLAKKYYLSGKADWITDEQMNTFVERITKMEPTLLGKKAPQIIISDLEGKVRDLHELGDGYTVLVFWNSSCGHCKKEMPALKELYINEIQPIGNVNVLAISTEQETDEWKKFINEHELITEGWIHAHDPNGRNPFRAQYNIESTPLVMVLSPSKEILAKRINIEDIKSLIEYHIRSRMSEVSEKQ